MLLFVHQYNYLWLFFLLLRLFLPCCILNTVPGGNNSIEVALERMFYSAVEGGQFEVCVVGTGGVVDTVGGRVISLMRSYRVGK